MTVPGFETTCPECAHVFDVAADDHSAPCPHCGALLEFDDDPAPTRQAPSPPPPGPSPEEQEQRRLQQAQRELLAKEKEARQREAAAQRVAQQKQAQAKKERLAAKRAEEQEKQRLVRIQEQEARRRERSKLVAKKQAERQARQRARNDEKLRRHAEKTGPAPVKAERQTKAKALADSNTRSNPGNTLVRFLRRSDRVHGKAVPVEELEGVGPAYSKLLAKQDIHNTLQLLDADDAALSESTGIPRKTLRRWQDMAELMAVSGIGKQYAEVLSRCGVQSVSDLARREAGTLFGLIQADHDQVGVTITKARLSPKRVQSWIDAAAKLRPHSATDADTVRKTKQQVRVLRPGKVPPARPDAAKAQAKAEATRQARQQALERRRKDVEATRAAKAEAVAQKQQEAEAARKKRAEALAARQSKQAKKAQLERSALAANDRAPRLESVSCPHCAHPFNTRAGRRKVTCPKCHSRLLLLAPGEADPTQARKEKMAAREASRRKGDEERQRIRQAKAAKVAAASAAAPSKAERPRNQKQDPPDAAARKASKANEAQARAEEIRQTKARRQEEKAQAEKQKADTVAARRLAKELGVEPDLAARMVKAGIRSIEDLARQDAQALYEKIMGGGA